MRGLHAFVDRRPVGARARRCGSPPPHRAPGDPGAVRAKALADPTRLTIAAALRDGGELCVCDLAWVTERSDGLVSHHARALRSAGLVASRREGRMVLYGLTEDGAALLEAVLPRVGSGQR